jgi:uncharacterized protein YdaU (DUF1376 family)
MSRRKSTSLWYPEYPGDYGRKTSHLSLAEHGAYKVLRDHYYSTSRPLPTSVDVLYRICRAFEAPDRGAVDAVVAEFFTLGADGYHNARCDEELARRGDLREKRQAAVNSRADRRVTIVASSVTTPTSTPIEEKRDDKSSLAPKPARASRFDEFWDAYPHRDGVKRARGKVEVKYRAAVKSGVSEQALLDAVARYRADKRVRDGFSCDPLRWFNGRGWEDEPIAASSLPADVAGLHAKTLDKLEVGFRSGKFYPVSMMDRESTEEMIRRGCLTREAAARHHYPLAAEPLRSAS